MLSARSLFQEILDDDRSFRLFCSIAASGEAQGGWENGRIAALVPQSMRDLAPKITRHGADEDKHGRIFHALLRKRGLDPVEVPPETDYTMLLERRGIGLAHEKLYRDEPLTEQDILVYLAHSRITEQRAADQMVMLIKYFGDNAEVGRAIRMISNDEDNHLAYCHEELLRLARKGHGRTIQRVLRECAMVEIQVYHQVGLAVMERMGRLLGWPAPKAALLAAGIHSVYAYERLAGWRKMVTLTPPERRDALGGPATAAPVF
ncbi:ferritin-like domain-containing protein [Streptomyces sp. AK02-01A]|uniref:ferritin-like domain-containing protein n=1 Tax=Streptomyces sp. AK02-01A TaxID=3028648 RepID=UPI0029AA4BCF|nr:ferritin-like domain-containing protein [Streptomyces sp. AK02-01A]MDX3850517.1 ferritin-like domain-containing protein [Streptomyces sp. AK02-01A]